jgi:hypothetical protein
MGLDYIQNVVGHLKENCDYFYYATIARAVVQRHGDLLLGRIPTDAIAEAAGAPALADVSFGGHFADARTAPSPAEYLVTECPAPTMAMVLDVDGVVSPVHGRTDWGDDVVAGNVFGPVVVSPSMVLRLDQLAGQPGIQAVWLTSWDAEMRTAMARFPGRHWPDAGTPSDAHAGASRNWWKLVALERWLAINPGIRAVAWCDDHLRGGRPGAVRRRLNRRGVDVLMIAPRTDHGLTPAHLGRLEAWLLR